MKYINKSAGRFFNLINKSDISEDEYQEIAGLLDKDKSLIREVYVEEDPRLRLKGNQPLHIACKKGDLRLAEMILARCDKQERSDLINQPDLEQFTPFYYICANKFSDGAVKLQLAKMLLENKANPDFINIYSGHTPKSAAEKRNPPIKALIDEMQLAQEQQEKRNQERNQSRILEAYDLMRQDYPQLEINFSKGADFNAKAKDKDGNSLLHHVCVGYLKQKNADISKDFELVRALITEGADLNSPNNIGDTSLTLAAKAGYNEMVKHLVKKYPDKIDYSASDQAGNRVLHAACHACSSATVKFLIEAIPQDQKELLLNQKDTNGGTPFMRAARSKNFAVVEMLLDYPEIKVNEIDADGCSMMHYLALENTDPALVDKVMQKIVPADLPALMGFSKTGYNPMHVACVGSKVEIHEAKTQIAEKFLQQGCAFNIADQAERQDYPIHIAAACANVPMMKLLLAHNAKVNVLNAALENPLHSVAMNGPEGEANNPNRVLIAQMLLAKGCELTALNKDGLSAFNYVDKSSALLKEFNHFFQQKIIQENQEIDQKCDELVFENWSPQRMTKSEVEDLLLDLFEDFEKEEPLMKEKALNYLCLKHDFDKSSKFLEKQIETLQLEEESAAKSQKQAELLERLKVNEEEYLEQLGSIQLIHEKYPKYILPQESDWKNLPKKEMVNFVNKVSARLVMDLIESGADVNNGIEIDENKEIEIDDSKIRRTPLLVACEQGNFLAAKIIVPHVQNLSLVDEHGNTALHYCAAHKNRDSKAVSEELIARGKFSFDLLNDTKESAIQIACQMGNHDLATDLISAGAKFKMADVGDILKDAIPDPNERKKVAMEFLKAHTEAAPTNSASDASASKVVKKVAVQQV